jgi:phage terminase small subunit
MTDKRKTFVEEYIVDFNATQAAIRAGYSPRSAGKQGSRLLNDKSVRAKIDARLAEIAKRCGSSRERILRELGRIAFFNPGGRIS